MAKIIWSDPDNKKIETGVDRGVLYVKDSATSETGYSTGVAWDGLTGVTESPSGAEPTPIYADNKKYMTLMSSEDYGVTIEAYTYPDEFAKCDGSSNLGAGVSIGQQGRVAFAMCYRTKIGTTDDPENAGYKIHIFYNGLASPSERAYATVNESPEAMTFSWEVSTTPIDVAATGMKPTACLTIDSTKIAPAKLATIEEKLYGNATSEPTILTPDEIKKILDVA